MGEAKSAGSGSKGRWLSWLLYGAYLVAFVTVSLFGVDWMLGKWLPAPDFPPNGLASPPLEDKTMSLYDFTYTASTNSKGLRDSEYPRESTRAFRIVAVGDSYTYGWGVELADAWIKQLEQILRSRGLDVEIINVGQPGVGPIEYVRNAMAAVAQYKPDMVMIGLLQGNDLAQSDPALMTLWARKLFPNLSRWARERDTLRVPRNVPEQRTTQSAETHRAFLRGVAEQMLEELEPEARARFDTRDEEVKEAFLEGLINPWMVIEAVRPGDYFTPPAYPDSRRTRSRTTGLSYLLDEIKDYAAEAGASLIVVSVPNGVYDNRHLLDRVRRIGYRVGLDVLHSKGPDIAAQRACDAAGVPYLQVTQVFRDRTDDPTLYFELDHHFTPKGHALFAASIAPLVEDQVRAKSSARD